MRLSKLLSAMASFFFWKSLEMPKGALGGPKMKKADVNDLKQKLTALNDERAPLAKEILDISAAAEKENRGYTADENEKYEQLKNKIVAIDTMALPLQNIVRINEEDDLITKDVQDNFDDYLSGKLNDSDNPRAAKEFEDNFRAHVMSKGSNAEILNALKKTKGFEDFYNSELGVSIDECLIPDHWERRIKAQMQKESVLLDLVTVRNVSWRRGRFPVCKKAGMAAPRKKAEEYCLCEPKYDKRLAEIHNLGCLTSLCIEDYEDAMVDMADEITAEYATAFARSVEHYGLLGEKGRTDFFDQTGTEKILPLTGCVPTGILNEITNVDSKSTGGITDIDIDELIYSVDSPYIMSGVFLGTLDVYKQLMQLRDADGKPCWQPSLQLGEPSMIRGREFHCSEHLPELASGNVPLIYGDFRRGVTAFIRKGLTMAFSDHFKFGTGEYAWRGDLRYDIVTMCPEALKGLLIK